MAIAEANTEANVTQGIGTIDSPTNEKRFLTALPVFNEVTSVNEVLDEVVRYSADVLVVDDGSSDGTSELLAKRLEEKGDISVVRHPNNRGYGGALITAFEYAAKHEFPILVTIDCDGQHEPQRIPELVAACDGVDIVSGSRYLEKPNDGSEPPADRRRVNKQITAELNERLGLKLTDAFCGFKAYRTVALQSMELTETGYAMPLELWVQAARAGLRIVESPVPLIYLDLTRSFGDQLDDTQVRLDYYHEVIDRSILKAEFPNAVPDPQRQSSG